MSVQKTTGTTVDLRAVVDDRIDPELPAGLELRSLATAMVTGQRLEETRAALSRAAGPQMAAAAIGVCANFEMMNRILDATGCPAPERLRFVAELLGIPR
ncbi:hypothetical protein [Modestobacter sp. DSM 44400]|uniref:hypothetical protein n=1 Tax=Modestobacter sp. DSM 44400 TaxID=1550230 RepID=UPI001115372E|nr:hypothetical protein [Modestobacter sp. DSM 44400]